jgi:hypothetical protein
MEKMQKFVHEQNLAHYRKLLDGSAGILHPQHQQILRLLTDEKQKTAGFQNSEMPHSLVASKF